MKPLLSNKQVLREYGLVDKYEAGIKLLGLEAKALREGRGNLRGSLVKIIEEKVLLVGFNLPPYSKSSDNHYNSTRSRRLLLNKREINKLAGFLSQKGLEAFPLKVYTKNNLIKLEIGVGRRLKKYEKKEVVKEKQERRDLDRSLRDKLD
ncbi:MAG: SsrA-binding protein [Patescibacteria group bacterium]